MGNIINYSDFTHAIEHNLELLKQYGAEVDPGRWQGVSTEGHPDLVTVELMDVAFRVHIPDTDDSDPMHQSRLGQLRDQIKPNLPWADDHFAERVSRVPSNPGEQYKNWPWWRGQDVNSMEQFGYDNDGDPILKFSHTYQERFWPKEAGKYTLDKGAMRTAHGIRYPYGDLDDVVNMLLKDPHTRQAYLPIFFPEDTGAVHGGRIPCSLGYHFLLRNDQLHLWYDIRSCDAVRHFRDDIYLAARLALWVIEECCNREVERNPADHAEHGGFWSGGDAWPGVRPGIMTFHAHSFHVHKGDMHLL